MAVAEDRGGRRATLLSRRQLDWTKNFPAIAAAGARLQVRSALIDGEVVVLLPDGRTDFSALQNARGGAGSRLTYYAFDLLFLEGQSLERLPLSERKARLEQLLSSQPTGPIRYADHFPGEGLPFFKAACEHRAEGIVSKKISAPYRAGSRNADWQKSKCVQRQEFVVGGYLTSAGAPLAALHIGYYDAEARLRFAGKVGTGFQSIESKLLAQLKPLSLPSCPFSADSRPKGKDFREALWVRPSLVVEVEFLEWTPDLHIRHPSFKGVREDREPSSVRAEVPQRPTS